MYRVLLVKITVTNDGRLNVTCHLFWVVPPLKTDQEVIQGVLDARMDYLSNNKGGDGMFAC